MSVTVIQHGWGGAFWRASGGQRIGRSALRSFSALCPWAISTRCQTGGYPFRLGQIYRGISLT